MGIKRSTFVMRGEIFFEPDVPIYVNRAYETFDMIEHAHEFIEITYVCEGSGIHYIAGEAVPVEHGTLFFIPVGHSHVFRPKTLRKDQPLIVYNCLFPVPYLSELSRGLPHAAEICGMFQDDQLGWFSMKDAAGEYHAIFREMYQEYTARPPGYLVVLASHVLRILTGLYRYRTQLDMPPAERPKWLTIDEAIDYIGQHYAEELRLGDMAAHANLSERQFSRLFKRQTGMSFLDYVQSIRIDAACRMLANGRQRVRDVAGAVGYQDMKYFHALFKRKTGVTPTEYRESVRPSVQLSGKRE